MIRDNWLINRINLSRKHQYEAFDRVNELVIKERSGRVVILENNTRVVEFISCSYLGLDTHPSVIKSACQDIERFGFTFPAARTRVRADSFVLLENLLTEIFCDSNVIIFSSLHLGHLGILPLLGSGELPSFPIQNSPLFIIDRTSHASIQILRSLLEQFGDVQRVNFQNQEALERAIQSAHKHNMTPITIADSIGSMGGITPVKWLLEQAEKYDGYVYLDDAHGMSLYGKNGCGYVLNQLGNTFHPRLILATSLAKAFGSVAGVIAFPTADDMEFAKRFASTYVFGGPPALPIINTAIASAHIHLSHELVNLQNELWSNVEFFDSTFKNSFEIINFGLQSPIRGIRVGDEGLAIDIGENLRILGYVGTVAMYPTVPKGQSIIRINLSSQHTKDQIRGLYKALNDVYAVKSNHV